MFIILHPFVYGNCQNKSVKTLLKFYNFKDSIVAHPYYSIEQALSVSGYHMDAVKVDQEEMGPFLYDAKIQTIGPSIAADPFAVIQKKLKDIDVLIVNEAHNKSNHRIFINNILIKFQNLFSIYLPESFIDRDCQIFQHKYPRLCDQYTFSNEPNYANIIRTALKLNYTILPYEYMNDSSVTIEMRDTNVIVYSKELNRTFTFTKIDFPYSDTKRELIQALNILKIHEKFPNKKIIVHCGYAHGSYKPGFIAAFLKKLKVKCLSIDQTYFNENLISDNCLKEYKQNEQLKSPYLLINPKDSNVCAFTGELPVAADIYLMHPPTKFRHDRPTWLIKNKGEWFVGINKIFSSEEKDNFYLIYLSEEFKKLGFDAVPADIIEERPNEEYVYGLIKNFTDITIIQINRKGKVVKQEFRNEN